MDEEKLNSQQEQDSSQQTAPAEPAPQVPDLETVRRELCSRAQAQRTLRDMESMAQGSEIERQLMEIHALDPTVNTIGDILKKDTAEDFRRRVARGYTLVDAFRLANEGEIARTQAAAQRQAELNSRAKSHLRSTAARGTGTATVPREVKRAYRELMPDATETEIISHYNKYKRKG